MRILGVLLNLAGVLALLYGQISYRTRETVFELGSIKATAEHEKSIVLPVFVGPASVGAGTLLLLLASRRRRSG